MKKIDKLEYKLTFYELQNDNKKKRRHYSMTSPLPYTFIFRL